MINKNVINPLNIQVQIYLKIFGYNRGLPYDHGMPKKMEEAIQRVVKDFDYTHKQIENELITYLQEKYFMPSPEEMLKNAIIQQAKELIISKLYNSTKCEISKGYNHYTTIPNYKFLLEIILSPAHRLYFEETIQELLDDDLIYTKTIDGDKEPKTVGLN